MKTVRFSVLGLVVVALALAACTGEGPKKKDPDADTARTPQGNCSVSVADSAAIAATLDLLASANVGVVGGGSVITTDLAANPILAGSPVACSGEEAVEILEGANAAIGNGSMPPDSKAGEGIAKALRFLAIELNERGLGVALARVTWILQRCSGPQLTPNACLDLLGQSTAGVVADLNTAVAQLDSTPRLGQGSRIIDALLALSRAIHDGSAR